MREEGTVATASPSRLRTVLWCAGVPLAAITAYLGAGIATVAAVGEPIVGTVLLSAAVAVVVGLARLRRPAWFAYRPETAPRQAVPGLGRAVAGAAVLAFLAGQSLAAWLYSIAGSAGFDQSNQARADAGVLLSAVLALVAAPVAEEMLFRGTIYPLLRRRASIAASALLTTAVFGLMHGNAVQFATTLPIALLMSLVYERWRALWPCMLLHLCFNLAAVLVPPVAIAGLANPVSALLLTAAFGGCALVIYHRIVDGSRPAAQVAGERGEEDEPRTA